MENLLIEIYLFVCRTYGTSSPTCYQRLSNNREPEFTDQELLTIWFFAHFAGCFEKKRMHRLIAKYWSELFPRLDAFGDDVHAHVPRQHDDGPDYLVLAVAAADEGAVYLQGVDWEAVQVGE